MPAPTLTLRQLNRATLARQLLLERVAMDPVLAVERVAGLQAQEPPSPYVGLWSRITDFDASTLDRAIATRALVKGTLFRVTLHLVTGVDYPLFRAALQPTFTQGRTQRRWHGGDAAFPEW